MTVFLHVRGNGDFGAMTFEQHYNPQEVYESMDTHRIELPDPEDEYCFLVVKIVEFDDVDPDFVSFVQDVLCDYDMLKSENIYQVEKVL